MCKRNKLEVAKILHTGEASRKISVLCHLINQYDLSPFGNQCNIHFIVIRRLNFLSDNPFT